MGMGNTRASALARDPPSRPYRPFNTQCQHRHRRAQLASPPSVDGAALIALSCRIKRPGRAAPGLHSPYKAETGPITAVSSTLLTRVSCPALHYRRPLLPPRCPECRGFSRFQASFLAHSVAAVLVLGRVARSNSLGAGEKIEPSIQRLFHNHT